MKHLSVVLKIVATLLSLAIASLPLFAQVNTGELRLKIKDPNGLGLKATVALSSEANQYLSELTTSDD